MFGVVPAGSSVKDTNSHGPPGSILYPPCSSERDSVSSLASNTKLWAVTEELPGAGDTPLNTPTGENLHTLRGRLCPDEPDEEPHALDIPTVAWHSSNSECHTNISSEKQQTAQDPVVTTTLSIPTIKVMKTPASGTSETSSLAESRDGRSSLGEPYSPDTIPSACGRRSSLSSNGRRSSLASTASMDSVESLMGMRSTAAFFKDLKGFWNKFTFFGVNQDDETPRVWGNRLRSMSQAGLDTHNGLHKTLSKMVSKHAYHDEMRLQLRDQRISLNYLDVFDNDGSLHGKWTIRVFSIGATVLEYLKIFAGMWTFVLSLMVVAFWDVLNLENDGTPTYLWLDLALDVVYAICLMYQLRTSILDVQTGREYCSRKAIHARNFFSKYFWFDVISCIPLIFVRGITSSTMTRLIALVKSLRGWRIFRIPPEHLFVPSTSFQLFQLSGLIMMGGHFVACIWFALVHDGEETMEHHSPISQSYKACLENDNGDGACWWNFYTVSINQGIYLLMGIECNAYSAWEHFFVTVCAPAGALVHAYMLGRIILLIQRRGALETKKNEHTMAIQEAMRTLDLPPDLQMRIVTFFTYERIHRSGRLFKELFEDLSPQLRFELQLHLYLDLVGKSQLFRKTKPRVIREIVMSLNDIIFLPGDWVCRSGDYGDSMYFIVSGECSVIDKDTVTELKVLQRQSYFGEVALLTGVARTASVRANKFCIMAHLTKDNFAPIVYKWPDEMDVLLVNVENVADKLKIKSEAAKLYGLSRRNSMSSEQQPGSALNSMSVSHAMQTYGAFNGQSGYAWRESKSDSTAATITTTSKESRSRSHSVPNVPTVKAEHMGPLSTMTNSQAIADIQKTLKQHLNDSPEPTSIPETKVGMQAFAIRPDAPNANNHIGATQHAVQSLTSVGGEGDRPTASKPTSNREALSHIQIQLNQVGARVLQLQRDVIDQRGFLTKSLHSVKNWAAEATKEAVTHEVQSSRRQSVHSVLTATNSVADMLLTPVT